MVFMRPTFEVPYCAIGNRVVALDGARHARRPQQLVVEVAVDELVQVQQVLQQLPALRERRRDELDERFGEIRGDVLVRQRRAERGAGARCCASRAVRRDAQRLLLYALAPALQDLRLAAVDEGGEAPSRRRDR